MNPACPARPAALRPHLSITLRGHLLFIELLFLALSNLGSLPLEELTEGRWRQMKRRTVFILKKQNSATVLMALQICWICIDCVYLLMLQHKHKPDEE